MDISLSRSVKSLFWLSGSLDLVQLRHRLHTRFQHCHFGDHLSIENVNEADVYCKYLTDSSRDFEIVSEN